MAQVDSLDLVVLTVLLVGSVAYFTKGTYWAVPKASAAIYGSANGMPKEGKTRNIIEKMDETGKNCVVFFGSQTGTAEDYASRLAKEGAQRFGLKTMVADLEDYDFENLDQFPEDKLQLWHFDIMSCSSLLTTPPEGLVGLQQQGELLISSAHLHRRRHAHQISEQEYQERKMAAEPEYVPRSTETVYHIAREVVQLLKQSGETLAVSESLTGGGVMATLTSVEGCSAVFRGGVVSYATPVKQHLLKVDGDLIAEHGVIHADVAAQMAAGARTVTTHQDMAPTSWGIGTTGVAGPDPQDGKPAVSEKLGDNFKLFTAFSPGDRQESATFYVCGDAANMAREVNAILAQIISEQRGLPPEKGEELVKNMRNMGMYQEDVWS
ncbi:conserved hypothetical protein [Uncinocarpus reesii 1704]|uniref:NADPH--hemoprotein reductase n=1 Tax=Uncinocarpus reesii (strain UAMH 1704) TaxID=336963 RepID=C4JDE7_UNCRE|nr:uncharacterized protein UREG_00312 [Uncinocarpus reesii 1704]EEP75466.1 conserved hypothetical protein [Uncinocarpus reesii 1704]